MDDPDLDARLDNVERRIGLSVYDGREILRRIEAIELATATLTAQGSMLMSAIDDLILQVAETKGVEAAAGVALADLRNQINTLVANATELDALKAQLVDLTTELDASEGALAAAIATPPPA